jgi:hypothetical protein
VKPLLATEKAISSLGSSIDPPWTNDHKTAAFAASMTLAREKTVAYPRAAQKSGPLRKGVEATELFGKRQT